VIVIGSDEDLRRVVTPSVIDLLRRCAGRLRTPSGDCGTDGGVAWFDLEA
jgi:hypothetical protein